MHNTQEVCMGKGEFFVLDELPSISVQFSSKLAKLEKDQRTGENS